MMVISPALGGSRDTRGHESRSTRGNTYAFKVPLNSDYLYYVYPPITYLCKMHGTVLVPRTLVTSFECFYSQDYCTTEQTVKVAPPAQPPPIAPIAHLPSKNSGDKRGSVIYEENIMSSCTGTAMCHEVGGRNYNRFLIAGVYILVVVGFLKHADILQQYNNYNKNGATNFGVPSSTSATAHAGHHIRKNNRAPSVCEAFSTSVPIFWKQFESEIKEAAVKNATWFLSNRITIPSFMIGLINCSEITTRAIRYDALLSTLLG